MPVKDAGHAAAGISAAAGKYGGKISVKISDPKKGLYGPAPYGPFCSGALGGARRASTGGHPPGSGY